MGYFREINIPGDVLDDDNLPDGAKLLYGKIARLSYKNGYCWASNTTLSGTKSGNTASRNIKLLEKFGYIKCVYENKMQERKIYICSIDSRINAKNDPSQKCDPPKNDDTPPKNDEGPSQKWGGGPPKNGEQTLQDITLQEEHPKQTLHENEPVCESETNKRYFIKQWQSYPDVFNIISRIHNPNDFDYWWEKSNITRKEIDIAIKNFVDGVRTGAIKRQYIPGSPDKFVLNGGIQRYQEPYIKKNGPSPPEEKIFGMESKGTVDIAALYKQFGITGTEPEKRQRLLELREKGVVSF
jgi:hypothetical protein